MRVRRCKFKSSLSSYCSVTSGSLLTSLCFSFLLSTMEALIPPLRGRWGNVWEGAWGPRALGLAHCRAPAGTARGAGPCPLGLWSQHVTQECTGTLKCHAHEPEWGVLHWPHKGRHSQPEPRLTTPPHTHAFLDLAR